MSDRMILEFSGWIECDPAKTTFQYIGGEALKNELGLLGQDFNSHIIILLHYCYGKPPAVGRWSVAAGRNGKADPLNMMSWAARSLR